MLASRLDAAGSESLVCIVHDSVNWISVDRLCRRFGQKRVFGLFIGLNPDQSFWVLFLKPTQLTG